MRRTREAKEWSCPYGDLDDVEADVLYQHLQLYHTDDMRKKAGLILCCPRVRTTSQDITFLWSWTAFPPALYNTSVSPFEYIAHDDDHKPRGGVQSKPEGEPAKGQQEPDGEPAKEDTQHCGQADPLLHDMCATFMNGVHALEVSDFQSGLALDGYFHLAGKKRKYHFSVTTVSPE